MKTSHRSPSLRTRVAIAAALGATIVMLIVGAVVWSGIRSDAYKSLDNRLDSISNVISPNFIAQFPDRPTGPTEIAATSNNGVAATGRFGALEISTTSITIPQLPVGYSNTTIEGQQYRVRTIEVNKELSLSLAVGTPIGDTEASIGEQQRNVVLVCLGSVAAAAILGWLFAGFAVRPLGQLAKQTSQIDAKLESGPEQIPLGIHGAKEAEDIAIAMEAMLRRIREEQQKTHSALESARDFAAVSAHELRTPLTAMRTNLEVLSTVELSQEHQQEVLMDALRTQSRIEETLTALERLAQGELSSSSDHLPLDLTDLLDRAAQDAQRTHPQVQVHLSVSEPLLISGLPVGLRLSVDNAITNAVRHGKATEIRLTVMVTNNSIDIYIDDNGIGLPLSERTRVFDRFIRGTTATAAGSGLGLALVAQQAALHGGSASLTSSNLGGIKLTITLPLSALITND
ncbi:MAG: sensor histidine kinase [Mycobacteriaceae bacterium]